MPTYSLKAPNGKTYNIDGPDGASEDDVRAEILRRDPSASTAPAAKPQGPPEATLQSTAGRAVRNLPMDALNTVKGLVAIPDAVTNAAIHPVQTAKAAGGFMSNVADVLTGGLQHVREMSPQALQGSAPKMDTGAYDKFAQGVKDQYGSKQALYKTVGDHPAGAALTVASLVDPALKLGSAAGKALPAIGEAVAGIPKPGLPRIPTPLKDIVTAGKRANAASAEMRGAATERLTASQAAATGEAEAATARSARAAALAERARTRGNTLFQRRAEAVANAGAPELDIGTPRHLSELGDTIRTPALEREGAISAEMRAADDKYRGAMEQVAADRAAAGVGVSDSAHAKALIKRSKALVQPDPVKRAAVGSIPADTAGGKLHTMLIDVLEPKEVPLTVKEAKAATRQGIKVNIAPDGSATRTIKPDLKAVDDFQRYVGKVLNGKVEGFEGLNAHEAREMYAGLTQVIDKYVKGAKAPVQANWRAGKLALEPYEKVRAGRTVVGTQKGTGVENVPASSIPGRMIAGGRDTVRQTAAVAGEEPVKAAVRSQVQNVLAGAKTADAAEAMVGPKTPLGDAVAADGDLSAAVQDYIGRVRAAEQSGTLAKDLEHRAGTASKRADRYGKLASALDGTATKASEAARGYQRELATLEIAEPKKVGKQYKSILDRAHADGSITTEQYRQGVELASTAEQAFKTKATRDKWLIRGAAYIGLPAVGTGVALHGFH